VAEQLCDRIAILKKGKLIFQGSLAELKSQYPDKDLETIYLEMAGRKIEEV
ncbi:MAG: ABC transporter ATP-binding protein, partial [Streptococcus sp.]